MYVGALVKLSYEYSNRMFLNTKSGKKVISWNCDEIGIITEIQGKYLYVLIPSGIGCCCVDEVENILT